MKPGAKKAIGWGIGLSLAALAGFLFLRSQKSNSSPLEGKLIKTASSPSVYFVEGGMKRPIPNEQIFERNFGSGAWNQIATVADEVVNALPSGAVVL